MKAETTPLKNDFIDKISGGDKRVLVVEDDPINRILIKKLLNNICLCDTASTKENAITMAKDNHYSLILMDIFINSESGIDALKEIRKDTRNKNTPVAAVTAYINNIEANLKGEPVFNKYFFKPFDTDQLLSYVRDVLGLKDSSKTADTAKI